MTEGGAVLAPPDISFHTPQEGGPGVSYVPTLSPAQANHYLHAYHGPGALHRSGDHDGAAAELQKAVADPRRALEARVTLARCFEAKGFGDLAAAEYQKALDGCPENDQRAREILYSLASLSEAAGDLDRARDLYTRIYEADVSFRDVAQKMEQLR